MRRRRRNQRRTSGRDRLDVELHRSQPYWIEKPHQPGRSSSATLPIARAVAGNGSTARMSTHRVMFKQLFQAQAIDVRQVDACRPGGVNEVVAVLLLAAIWIPVIRTRRRRPVRVGPAPLDRRLRRDQRRARRPDDRVRQPPPRALPRADVIRDGTTACRSSELRGADAA